MKKRRELLWDLAIVFGDIILISISFILAYYLRFHLQLSFVEYPIAPFMEYLKAVILANYLTIFVFLALGLYKRERSRTAIDDINKILVGYSAVIIFLISLTFFYREFSYSRLVSIYAWIIGLVLLSIFRVILKKLETFVYKHGLGLRKILILGSGGMADMLKDKIKNSPEIGYVFYAQLPLEAINSQPILFQSENDKSSAFKSDFVNLLTAAGIDEVFIAEPEVDQIKLLEIINACEGKNVRVHMIPKIYDLLINYNDVSILDGLPLVSLAEKPISELKMAVKRLFDIIFSLFVLLFSFPIWPLIMVLIKLDSKGPIFFRQARVGQDGKIFKIIKFRTMVENAEELLPELLAKQNLQEPVFKLENDPRVTKVGKFLRRWSLDELPQFINVLKGDMSVVGPRPEEVHFVKMYNPWQRRRLKVKPGITGLQQVMCRGAANLSQRVRYDIYYIRRQSLLLDISIILKTLWVVITGKGTI